MLTPHLQFLLAAMAGWVNRSQQDVIEYLLAENRIPSRAEIRPLEKGSDNGVVFVALANNSGLPLTCVPAYHLERNHQGLDNRLIERSRGQPPDVGRVACRERLGGVLRFYYRETA